MARYVDAIDLPVPIEEAFDYLADFSRTVEWDPGVVEARRLTRGPVRVGSLFRVVVSTLGRRIPLEYEVTELDRPSRLVLSGGDSSLRSIDEMTFVSRPGGTRVTYEARLELTGVRRLADPLLDLLFQRIGRLAVCGLRERMSGDQAEMAGGNASARADHEAGARGPGRSKSDRKVDDREGRGFTSSEQPERIGSPRAKPVKRARRKVA